MVTPDRPVPNCQTPRARVRPPLLRGLSVRAALLVAFAVAPATSYAAAGIDPDDGLAGPDIRIILERTLYEFRQNGQLRMVRVEPKIGQPYYLVPRDPTKGFGDLMRADMLLPSWVLVRF